MRSVEPGSPLAGARWFLIYLSGLASILIAALVIPLLLLLYIGGGWLPETAGSLEALSAVALSLGAGAASASISTLFGTPLAYILSRLEFRGKSLIQGLLDLPLILPHTVAGIALLLAFNSRAPLGLLLSSAGLRVEDSLYGVVLAMVFVSSPFAVNFAKRGFDSVDLELEKVARSMGASAQRVFLTISLPLASRSILTGWLMSLARAISEVGAIMVVAYHPTVAGVLVYEWFLTRGLRAAAGLSVLLLLASLAILSGLRAMEEG